MARILVVEDDHDLLFLYDTTLTRLGHEIVTCDRTQTALQHLEYDDPFELVILDMNMPDISGMHVLEAIHATPKLNGLPVVVVSANGQYRAACYDFGVEHFLLKPVPTRQLLSLLNNLFEVG